MGVLGGGGAAKSAGLIRCADGTELRTDTNAFYTMNYGDVWETWSSGGGGYGNPLERPVERVLDDVIDELVSVEAARRDYGVVIDQATLAVDGVETKKLRDSGVEASPPV